MAEAEKALDKIDIASELKTLSPIEKRSLELKQMAESIEITDKSTYLEAKKVKRELVSHRTATKDLRLTFTRKLDNLKDQFIKKQDAVLEPSIAGEDVIKEKIAAWEKAEAERKEAEERRIADMVAKIVAIPNGFNVQTGSLNDVKRLRAALKMERGLLDANDRNRVAVKNATEEVARKLDSAEEFITARIEQERIAEEQRKEQERLDAERKKLEEEKKAEAERVAAERKAEAEKQEAVNAEANMKAEKEKLEKTTTVQPEVPTPASPPKETLEPKPGTKLWYVVTEECIEGTGKESPLEALIEYLYLGEDTEERVDEILKGDTEINYVAQYTREELAAMPEV